MELRNLYVPLKEIDCQSLKRKGSIPIRKDLQREVTEKRWLHRKLARSSFPTEKRRNLQIYIAASNRVNRMMTRAHRNL